VRSPIAFYQMIGRGTRLDPPSDKLMFRVYDYTDATRLFGEEFKSKFRPPRREGDEPPEPPEPPERTLQVEGFNVRSATSTHPGSPRSLPRRQPTLKALAGQFARTGTESLENPQGFQMPEVVRAGGLAALRTLGEPADVLHQTKERLFAA
jgi:superfamily II DNA or RNA helicase